jgi:branched-chain amino acid transport system ATP-binding protein
MRDADAAQRLRHAVVDRGKRLLEVQNLSAWYGPAQVLWDVCLSVGEGQALGVIGRNGAGKSTLLLSITRVHKASSGSILLDGLSVSNIGPCQVARAGVAFVRETAPVFTQSSVLDHLLVGRELAPRRGMTPIPLEELLATFPILAENLHRRAGLLSGGQRQLLALAVALSSRPRLLVLDEPSTGLAPEAAASVFDVIRALVRDGLSVLIAEQNQDWLNAVADSVVVLDAGRIVGQTSSSEPEGQIRDDSVTEGVRCSSEKECLWESL